MTHKSSNFSQTPYSINLFSDFKEFVVESTSSECIVRYAPPHATIGGRSTEVDATASLCAICHRERSEARQWHKFELLSRVSASLPLRRCSRQTTCSSSPIPHSIFVDVHYYTPAVPHPLHPFGLTRLSLLLMKPHSSRQSSVIPTTLPVLTSVFVFISSFCLRGRVSLAPVTAQQFPIHF